MTSKPSIDMSLYEVTFTWPGRDAESVIITGSFDDWAQSVHLDKVSDGFSGTVSLPYCATILYQYVVDGNWLIRNDEPCRHDPSRGATINILVTPPKYTSCLSYPSATGWQASLPSHLPPPEILDEIVAQITTAFSPSVQKQAVGSSEQGGKRREPIIGLYCPIEGGDYVVDATVNEAARRANAEVLTLDLVQLASNGEKAIEEEIPLRDWDAVNTDDDDDNWSQDPWDDLDSDDGADEDKAEELSAPEEGSEKIESEKEAEASLPIFFDMLVNTPSSPPSSSGPATMLLDSSAVQPSVMPRLVYVRDPYVLSRSSRKWFPAFLTAIRRRRRAGSLSDNSRTSNVHINPTVILFGCTPRLRQPRVFSSSSDTKVLEDEYQKRQDVRLKARIESWIEDGSELPLSKLPRLARSGWSSSPSRVVVRTIFPQSTDRQAGRSALAQRRREINILSMRMAVQSVGGFLFESHAGRHGILDTEMWQAWGDRIQLQQEFECIAKRAVTVPAAHGTCTSDRTRTPMQWNAILEARILERNARLAEERLRLARKTWANKEFRVKAGTGPDKIVDSVKNSCDDDNERKLFPCIVERGAISTTFKDVHLPAITIDALRSLVSLSILHPELFARGILKAHAMTGALLFGPPGTGKTLVARALAKESGACMLMLKPSDILDKYVGEEEKNIRAAFSLAKRLSPCIIFIDEIDFLFSKRRSDGDQQWRRDMAAEFLQVLDGLATTEERIVVLGATNRPFDLDEAFLRRLPRRLLIDLPDERDREAILRILLRDEKVAEESIIHWVARRTESYSGSDLKNLCVAVAMDAAKEHLELPWVTVTTGNRWQDSTLNSSTPRIEEKKAQDGPTVTDNGYTLQSRHFEKCLREMKASTSKSQLAELKSWDKDFGGGTGVGGGPNLGGGTDVGGGTNVGGGPNLEGGTNPAASLGGETNRGGRAGRYAWRD